MIEKPVYVDLVELYKHGSIEFEPVITRIKCSSSLRPEVQTNKYLKELSTKPMNQLTDQQLSMIYKVEFKYLSNRENSETPCTNCSLCNKRKNQNNEV